MTTPKTRDYFAEMYVAGLLGDAHWNVFFPKRDVGFDMIATIGKGDSVVIRPIQVKGLYPTAEKREKQRYGYVGSLSQVHKHMALVLVFFDVQTDTPSPRHVAWMPRAKVLPQASREYKCQPGKFVDGKAEPRRESKKYFGRSGLEQMALIDWQ